MSTTNMNIKKKKKIRVPIIPLNKDSSNIADNSEIIVDTKNRKLYVKNHNTDEIIDLISPEYIKEIMKPEVDRVIDNADINYNTIGKIDRIIDNIETWKKNIESPSDEDHNKTKLVNNLEKIFDKFKDMSENDQSVIELLNKKKSKEVGKDLVDVDYLDEYKEKLKNIDSKANRYVHPFKLQCNHKPLVTSVNGIRNINKGHIWISYKDFDELKNIDPNANYYTHPPNQVCLHKFSVSSVNGESGEVHLTKSSFDIDRLKNYRLAIEEDINSDSDNTILSHKDALKIIDDFILGLL